MSSSLTNLLVSCKLQDNALEKICGELISITRDVEAKDMYTVKVDTGHNVIAVSRLYAEEIEVSFRTDNRFE